MKELIKKLRLTIILPCLFYFFFPFICKGEENTDFSFSAPEISYNQGFRLKTNILPWLLTIPNIGAEYLFAEKWSVELNVWYCPWKLTDKISVKTVSILPEFRWWIKSNRKGSFLNIHLDFAWFNVRMNNYRYQDPGRPLLGGGIGYGYRLELDKRWGMEFEIGAGFVNARYDRYYNVPNGELIDTRVSSIITIDRAAITVSYNLGDL